MEPNSRVHIYYRSLRSVPSIGRVFDTLVPWLGRWFDVTKVYAPCHRADLRSVVRNFRACRKRRTVGVNHISGDIHYCILAFPRRTTVLTVHDIEFYERLSGLKRRMKWLLWIYLPVTHARRVTCISDYTRERLLAAVKTDSTKIVVIPNPVDGDIVFRPRPFCAEKPVILHIGTKHNKNLGRVMEALRGSDCHLRIIGPLKPGETGMLEAYGIEYSNASDLDNAQMAAEYERCDIVCFPSTYEGFGMPIVEGQAAGRVVLTSDLRPMADVAGGGALLVDPFDAASIRSGFQRLAADGALREELIARGFENVKRFDAAAVAQSYGSVYEEILGS